MNEPAILWERLAIGNRQFDGAFHPMESVNKQQSAISTRQNKIAADSVDSRRSRRISRESRE
jgi:hypothetical protein